MEEKGSKQNNTSNICVDIGQYWSQFTFDWTSTIAVRALVGVIYALIFFVGVIGNASVIVRVINDRKLHSAQYIFLLNLMASDFLLCLTSVPFSPVAILMKHWIFGGVLCRAIPLCQAMSVVITSLSLTAIAVDKYVHITDSTRAPLALSQALVVVACTWTVSCGLSLPLVLSYGVQDGSAYFDELGVSFCGKFCDEWSTLEYRKIYGTSVMSIQFVVPMFIIAFCYTSILRKVQQDMMIENKQFAESLSTDQRLEATRKKRKLTFILILMVVAFIGSWAPLTLFNILRDYDHVPSFVRSQPYFWALIVNSTAMSSVIWNPLLFFWLTGAKQRASRKHSVLADSAILSFLLAFNPLRTIFKKNRQSDGEVKRPVRRGTTAGTACESSDAGDDKNANINQCSTKKLTSNRDQPVFVNAMRLNARSVSFGIGPVNEGVTSPTAVTTFCRKAPLIRANEKKRSLPSSLERYCLLGEQCSKISPRAPRVANESFSDLGSVDADARDEMKTDSASSAEDDSQAIMITKEKTTKDRKSLIYVHLRQSSDFA